MSLELEVSLKEVGKSMRQICRLCHSLITGSPNRQNKCEACCSAVQRSSGKARDIVKKAIDNGELKLITGDMQCIDCGAPAQCRDHRDYNKPLEIELVCRPCDQKRGPGKPRVEFWHPEMAAKLPQWVQAEHRIREIIGHEDWNAACENLMLLRFAESDSLAAQIVFEDILNGLDASPSYLRGVVQYYLGTCLEWRPRPGAAARCYRQALAEAEQLEPTRSVRRQIGGLQLALAGALMKFGDLPAAREAAEAAWKTAEALGDRLLRAQVNLQLAALDLLEGRSGVLSRRFQESDHLEGMGDAASLAWPWGAVAAVAAGVKRPRAAGAWYQQLVTGRQKRGKVKYILAAAEALGRLADLLGQQRQCLTVARRLAEQALAFKQHVIHTLNARPTSLVWYRRQELRAVQIWATYEILAVIATHQGESVKAEDYNQQAYEARQTYATD